MVVFDCGSGNTCGNNADYARRMVLEIAQLKIPGAVVKWQLFKEAGDNVPLDWNVFDAAYRYALVRGLNTTASVFDVESLKFLLGYGVPFIKIANCAASKDMLKMIPAIMPKIVSSDDPNYKPLTKNTSVLRCISEYPADKQKYIDTFGAKLADGISDHTTDFSLFKQYQPAIYEFHFKLDDSTGLDAGAFARTPAQVKTLMDPDFDAMLTEALSTDAQ